MSVLRTSDAKNVYKEIVEIIKNYIITKKAKENFTLNLFTDPDEIIVMQNKIYRYLKIDESVINEIRKILDKFELKKPNDFFVNRIVVADNESYEKFIWIKKYCNLMTEGEIDKARGHIITIDEDTPVEEILPEFFIINFAANKETIKKIYEIYLLLKGLNIENIKDETIEKLKEILNVIECFTEKCEIDTEIFNKKRNILKNFKGIVYEHQQRINSEIIKEVEKRSMKIDAKEILTKNLKNISQIHPIGKIINDVVENHLSKIIEDFGINRTNIVSIFEREYHVRIDEEEMNKFLDEISNEIMEEEYEYKIKAVKKLPDFGFIENLCEKIYSIDEILGIVKFAKEKNCVMPKISDVLFFKNAKNLLISNSIPVTYSLGGEIEKRKVAMLTGANSGGKTTLLKTILQIQILAQSGLPVPCEYCEFPIVNEIYLLGKHTGTLSAGAFESTLKTISKILISKAKKIVLIDELEAITEPGAAAKMISAILEILIENNDFAVVVTHLGDEILKYANKDVRIDGIEAAGLDENLNLVVDRQPKFNKIGKSTPELIVERLYRLNRNEKEGEIYKRIFEKMKK